MKIRISIIWTLINLFFISGSLKADEGMWIPLLIEKYNIKLMQEKGFRLSAEDIYSVNKACMKDAVLRFGGGCTGEIISGEGLLITNHHCGRSNIQQLSSIGHDYLANGFWAMSGREELPCAGLSVTILKRMEDVTTSVLKGVTESMPVSEREKLISSNIEKIESAASEGTRYKASVSSFYMGNQYFLFVNEIFRDVRFVGAPPVTIGNFGSETDNWVWPRHTGDFSLFRIYADKDNAPASYSKDNVPYKPAYFFPISIKGVKEGDFTMVFGYPGSTVEYVPSYYIDMVRNYINPKLIGIRTKKIEIMEAAMETDPLIRLQYFVKKSGIANSWKKWQGELLGLDRMNTVAKKQEYESRLMAWVNSDESRKQTYDDLLPAYEELYKKLKDYSLVNSYTTEVFTGADAFSLWTAAKKLSDMISNNATEEEMSQAKESIIKSSASFFRNFDRETDRKLFAAVLEMYGKNLQDKWLLPAYVKFRDVWKSDFDKAATSIYSKSPFTDEARFRAFVTGFKKSTVSKLDKDPIYVLASGASEFVRNSITPVYTGLKADERELNRRYMLAQMEFERERIFYPDANSTLRLAYGNVLGYKSRDAVYFTPSTTISGIMEKDNPQVFDYDVPDKLKELYKSKDFGRYSSDGDVPVCFIANNHTTGGNSGSPVINADGQLIGVNFDRAWEGVASDMAYNPQQSRNISLDIRYALFIIDKFAGAGYLLDEMVIVE